MWFLVGWCAFNTLALAVAFFAIGKTNDTLLGFLNLYARQLRALRETMN